MPSKKTVGYLDNDLHGIAVTQIRKNKVKEYYQHNIKLHCKNKIVVDLGAGSGILSFLAVQAGAIKVFAIEKDQLICHMLKQSIKKLGWEDKIVVVYADFVHDDISEYLAAAEVCVSEIINISFTNNIFPYTIQTIKQRFSHLKIIPDRFNYHIDVIENEFLDKIINWGYSDDLNSVFDQIFLEFTILKPIKLLQTNVDKETVISSNFAVKYNFIKNTIELNAIMLPVDKKNKWFKIYWTLDNKIYNDHWQTEYIPLTINYFNNIDSITLEPSSYVHKIKKTVDK